MINYISPKRLLEYVDTMFWTDDGISIDEIENLIGVADITYEECDPFRLNQKPYNEKMWHIGRVKYFVNNPNKIDAIEIFEEDIKSEAIIYDGNHRYIASVILGLDRIPCEYEGSKEFLDYLTQ